jgi:ABC-type lipoprotein release transport system permease subunit
LYIAKRYLFAKRSFNIINLISRISIAGVAFASAALIIVLSAFNGLENLVEGLYAKFDPEIKISASKGKTFSIDTVPLHQLQSVKEIETISETLEEVALFKYKKNQTIGVIKGVDENFAHISDIDSAIISGDFVLTENDFNYATIGYGIAQKLAVNLGDIATNLWVIVPKRGIKKSINPLNDFQKKYIIPTAIFGINADFDDKYVIAPLRFVQSLLQKHENEVSALEIKLTTNANPENVKQKIKQLLGNHYQIKTRFELNEILYKTNKTEKWITFFILSFILVIATFNIISSMAMLILDKKNDFKTFKSMGATDFDIKRIFFYNGMLINAIGAGIGLGFGTILCLLQQYIGLIPLQGGIVEYYPVKVMWQDFIFIIAIVGVIGAIASWYPVRFLKSVNTN